MSAFVLFFIILAEGFVTISAEILTIRQLLPVAGNSVMVTSLIIGVFLLFLAYGYRRGGQYHNNYLQVLKRNFTFSAIWLGIGLSYLWIELFFNQFRQHVGQEILLALSAYLILITAPLVYLLGQTVPITMNIIKEQNKIAGAGAIGGKVLHLSTLGSFLGAVLTTLLLMEYLGVGWTVVINFAVLAILTLVLLSYKIKDMLRLMVLLIMLVIVYQYNVGFEKKRMIASNHYGNYQVAYLNEDKYLIINNSGSSLLTPNSKGFPYVELIKRILFTDLNLKSKDILVLGAGGFSISSESVDKNESNQFTYVDIDKNLESIVKKHFSSHIKGEFIASDARAFLQSNTKKFDVIISDAYSHERSMPAHLLTYQYFNQIRQTLQPSGIAVFNIVAKPSLQDRYSKRVDNTIRSVFNGCMTIPVQYTQTVNNIVYVCQNHSVTSPEIYTDDLNQATVDFFNISY